MEPMSREHIIELINQYIYTNGNQQITAAQLHEILIDIANAFALQGTAAGIENVLAAGSAVTAGRKITNSQGGELSLAANTTIKGNPYAYIGFDSSAATFQSIDYTGIGQSVMGSYKRSGPTRKLLDQIGEDVLPDGEILAAVGFATSGVGKEGPDNGVHLISISNKGRNSMKIGPNEINALMNSPDGKSSYIVGNVDDISTGVADSTGDSAYQSLNYNRQRTTIYTSDNNRKIMKTLTTGGETWAIDDETVTAVDAEGLALLENKKLRLSKTGDAPTAGLATLSGGSVTVNTSAVSADSVINLTVQNGGAFTGNIRVSAKTAGTGFTITSTQDTDSCTVFWQIIDLLG